MVNNERNSVVEGSNSRPSNDREESPRASDETLVGRPQAEPLPTKQGELGYISPPSVPLQAPNQDIGQSQSEAPVRHPADRGTSPANPDPNPVATQHPNASTTSLPSSFKQFIRTPRPLPTIRGVRSTTVLRVVFTTLVLIAAIVGWIVTVVRMNAWDKKGSVFTPPPPQSINSEEATTDTPPPDPLDQMTHSSLVFVHVAFGASVLFLLLMLERAVYRFRAERYAHLHPEEMATVTEVNGVMGLSPWNRPPLPSYAAALGVRGTGDVEDNVIAAPPPPEYGNTRGSTLLLTSHHLAGSRSQPTSTSQPSDEGRRDALGRPVQDWSRPVSYAEDEMRENLRRSLDLEAALARLEGPSRPESALTRR
ncbi:hypothetical protein BN14_04770 [Rhizoctonia solani AG-1 IB]|uniref:Transmembrane protein n=1 Tax=Thanatephorus cucumeris (strain AG1-IB / isolate 7/3/14) TaxID=1108050 RepID=M5BW11_THACB|nr:hypothetical protein BN14_04770 [Rhizoctonia solani AG-1 IB]